MKGKNKGKKLRLTELEDQPWFPNWLRDYQTAFLASLDGLIGLYAPVNDLLSRIQPKPKIVVDLASGSGRSAMRSTRELRSHGTELILTDKYPPGDEGLRMNYLNEPIDVTSSSFPKGDFYTMFNAFHHFEPKNRLPIIAKATSQGRGILIVEPLQPKLSIFVKVFLSTLLGPFILAPFMKPFRLRWLLLTYVIPLGVIATWLDGMASVWRSLGEREWEDLEKDCKQAGFKVEKGLLPTTMAELKYFMVR